MRSLSFLFLCALPLVSAPAAKDTCYECHLRLRGKLKAPSSLWANDVHGQSGLTCTICHRGDALEEEMKASKTPEFIGTFYRPDVARLCGDCHADAERIHKSNAKLPLDQLTQFQASVHGKRFAVGDEAAANCTASTTSARYASLRQPDTCGRCHSNPAVKESRKLPVNQGLGSVALAAQPKIEYRTLGKTRLKLSSVGFGCMVTSDASVIDRALDLGINYFDTARDYQGGNNERMLGTAVKSRSPWWSLTASSTPSW